MDGTTVINNLSVVIVTYLQELEGRSLRLSIAGEKRSTLNLK